MNVKLLPSAAWMLAAALSAGLTASSAAGLEQRQVIVTATGADANATASATEGDQTQITVAATGSVSAEEPAGIPSGPKEKRLIIQTIEPTEKGKNLANRAWLGVAAEEASDALAAQLELKPGEGLLVTLVSPDSPAAKAGLQTHDVLIDFDGQTLVHPTQLRKLVRMHQPGDTIKLALYRAGKKQSVSVTLAKVGHNLALLPNEGDLRGNLQELQLQLNDLNIRGNVEDQMKAVREALARAGVNQDNVRIEVKRGLDEARKAVQEALRNTTNALSAIGPAAKDLEALAQASLDNATVVVKKAGHSVRTMVKSDGTGTYVIVADPKKHLTVHDKDGKLVFDGAIETPEQQAKVPKEVWGKVEPMLDQDKGDKGEKAEAESDPKTE